MTLYDILGVPKNASKDEIKKAYRSLAKASHPDHNLGDPTATAKFIEIQNAYDILYDDVKRTEYDRFGTINNRPPPTRPASKPDDFFKNVWEEFFGGSQDRGRNIQIRVEIELKEILTGTKKPVKISQKGRCATCEGKGFSDWQSCSNCSGSGRAFLKQNPFNIFMTCTACRGSGRSGTIKCTDCLGTSFTPIGDKMISVEIPFGIETGMQIRLPGEGEPGAHGSRNGDVFIIVVVKEHDLYLRQGKDIIIEVPVSYTQLALGDNVTIPTLESTKVDFNIPAGTQSGTRFRMKGLGLPSIKNAERGDLIATVKLEVPMTPKYKNILEKLAKCEKENITPKQDAFNQKVHACKKE